MTSNGEKLGDADVKRGIFQGDSLSPLFFVLAMIPLSLLNNPWPLLLRKDNVSYKWGERI